jgi:hypothetical protein
MKRIFIVILFGSIIGLFTSAYAQAADVSFSAASAYARKGETVTVPVYADIENGFASFTIDVNYDNTAMTPVSVSKGEALNGYLIPNTAYNENTVRAVYAGAQNITRSGNILYLTFELISDRDIISDISLNVNFLANVDYKQLSRSVENGRVGVSVKQWMPVVSEVEFKDRTAHVYVKDLIPDANESKTVYIAQYDKNGRMISVQSVKAVISDEGITLESEINVETAEKIMVFVWDDNMTPRAVPAELML